MRSRRCARGGCRSRRRSQQPAAAAASASRRTGAQPQLQGRWSLDAPPVRAAPDREGARPGARGAAARAPRLVARETVVAERVPGGFATVYAELSALETLGSARRGYFVEGLGGAQFALSAAVERLRTHREAPGEAVVLAAQDPANLYGAVLPWPRRASRRGARARAGAYVVLLDGRAVLYVEAGGRGLVRCDHPRSGCPALDALADFVRSGGPRGSRRALDGEP